MKNTFSLNTTAKYVIWWAEFADTGYLAGTQYSHDHMLYGHDLDTETSDVWETIFGWPVSYLSVLPDVIGPFFF